MASVSEQAQTRGVDVYLVKVKNGDEYLAYGQNKLIATVKILNACRLAVSHFFIRWSGHEPEDMGIFRDEE